MPYTLIGDVMVNATPQENPNFSNQITDKPVEDGVSIADHVENEPATLDLECVFTDQGNITAAEKYEKLIKMRDEKELIEVVSGLQVYEDMVIENFSPIKDADIANGFRAEIILKQIRIVNQDTIEVDLGVDPVTGSQTQGEDSEIEKTSSGSEEVDEDTYDSALWRASPWHGDDN